MSIRLSVRKAKAPAFSAQSGFVRQKDGGAKEG